MIFLVEMEFIKSGDMSGPADGIHVIEQIIQPTLEDMCKVEAGKKNPRGRPRKRGEQAGFHNECRIS